MGEEVTPERTALGPESFAQLLAANAARLSKQYGKALAIYLGIAESCARPGIYAAVADCHFMLAAQNAASADENYRQAVEWMERATSLAPSAPQWHARLGDYLQLGTLDYPRAAREYRCAIALGTRDAHVFAMAAFLYRTPEDVVVLDEAIAWLQAAAELQPEDPDTHFSLGRLYQEAGRTQEAAMEWEQALLRRLPLRGRESEAIGAWVNSRQDASGAGCGHTSTPGNG